MKREPPCPHLNEPPVTLLARLGKATSRLRRKLGESLGSIGKQPGLALSAGPHEATFITLDAPGAATCCGLGTFCASITSAGAITGYYLDGSNVFHGLLRDPDGTTTAFEAPGARASGFQGTFAFSINPAGAITGYYLGGSSVFHGFVRAPDGAITTLRLQALAHSVSRAPSPSVSTRRK